MTARSTHPHAGAVTRLLILIAALALLVTGLTAPTAPASAQPAVSATFDGDPETTERIVADDPARAAIEVSQVRFADDGDAAGTADGGNGPRQAQHAVLATIDGFADSLAGAGLTGDGPLVLTDSASLSDAAATELARVLPSGATVYLLGGEQALAPAVADAVTDLGFTPSRLAGETRVETALAVATEMVRLEPGTTVLLARSEGTASNPTAAWADSMTGGSLAAAAGIPILITPTGALHPAVAAWLDANGITRTLLLGGEAALSDAVEAAVPGPQRFDGPERTSTAASIAESAFWPRGEGRRHVIVDGGRDDGWAYGLAAAGIAADAGAPPLMVVRDVSPATRREVSTCGAADVDLVLVGDDAVIGSDVGQALDTFDGQACAPDGTPLNPFTSCDAALEHFIARGLEEVGPYGLDGHYYGGPIAVDFVEPQPVPEPSAEGEESGNSPTAAPDSGESDAVAADGQDSAGAVDDVSQTNVQEVGVDEPDQVKLNAEAAFVADGNTVQVIALDPDRGPSFLTSISIDGAGFGNELLLLEDTLIVVGDRSAYVQPDGTAPDDTAFAPEYYYPDPETQITRIDVSDPAAPQILDTSTVDGSYRSARMVSGVIRLVTSSNPSGLDFVFPSNESERAQTAALEHNQQVIRDTTLANWLPQIDGSLDLLDCGDVFVPPGYAGIATTMVATIDAATGASPTSATAVVADAETIYASQSRLVVSSTEWGRWEGDVPPSDEVSTNLHSFDVTDPTRSTYVASGRVPGYVLNRYAISEQDRYYRIATTTSPPWGFDFSSQSDNGITILTEGGGELFEVGRVFGLGRGEQIHAVRYMGDIAAVITFRQVDPLYLVDLSNPQAPRVTGELKIPGVSRYLHPIGEDHLLGVGQDGDDDGRLTGLQVSLFDIADRANPTRVDSLEFGPGDSPVEFDPRAFLYWAQLGRALVPSTLYGENFDNVRSEVQAIDIDPAAERLDLAGAVRQPSDVEFPAQITRTFIAQGVLYTLSYDGVSGHDLASLADKGFAPLPDREQGCCIAID